MVDGIHGPDEPAPDARPIFILGILPRCGTNFLMDLLRIHPDCEAPEPIWEDSFLYHADLLLRYVESVYEEWNPQWGIDRSLYDELVSDLGSGVTAFLSRRTSAARVVTKTPRVDNLLSFFKLFPHAYLLILVRDGRSILESGIRTFGWNRESALHRLADAARSIQRFDETYRGDRERYLIVRYEDLWEKLTDEMNRILDFLNLDRTRYDMESAVHLPVRGSSSLKDQCDQAVHWKPMEKPSGFDPMARWRHWSGAQHDRYNRVAGRFLSRFGYEEQQPAGSRWVWTLWNFVQEIKWLAIRTLGPSWVKLAGRR